DGDADEHDEKDDCERQAGAGASAFAAARTIVIIVVIAPAAGAVVVVVIAAGAGGGLVARAAGGGLRRLRAPAARGVSCRGGPVAPSRRPHRQSERHGSNAGI